MVRIIKGNAAEVLAHAYSKGRMVYYWLTSGDAITGCFRDKRGRLVGVSTCRNYGALRESKVFYAMDFNPHAPGKVATLEAMAAYRAKQIAEYAA